MFDATLSRRTFLATLGAGTVTTLAGCGGGSDGPNWGNLDKILADAVAANDAPFLVAAVSDRNGVLWQGATGQATASRKASQDVIFHLYSATKAIGSLACMILLDRGKVTLDTKLIDIAPEFATAYPHSNKVVVSVDPLTGPVYRDPATPVTLRHLLTHTSGLAYGTWDKKEFDWEAYTAWPSTLEATVKSFSHPLMFDPGTNWTYGVGIDWAGFLVEHVDGRSIDQFCFEEIFEPLSMFDTMFEVDAVTHRLADIKIRNADGSLGDANFFAPPPRPPKYGMGQACRGTALDYLKLCRLVLNDGKVNGRPIVSSSTMALMKQNQIGSLRLPLPMTCNIPAIGADLDLFPGLGIPLSHTTGFVRNEVDIPGRRRAGSLTWAGFLNTHYWIDPASGISAVLFTQSVPFIEPRFQGIYAAFEKAVYSELAKA